LLDSLFADPRRRHPVAAFGSAAAALERRVWRDSVAAGAAYAAGCAAVPVLIGVGLERATRHHPTLRSAATATAAWAVLGGTSLAREARAMTNLLAADDLPAARRRLAHLCARDATGAGPAELVRATVESVAENTGDAAVGPLWWGAVAGVPGLLGHRAINTIDAMVGYRNARYLRFGRVAARLDDLANLIPARACGVLTVAVAGVVGGRPSATARVLRADRRAHPSPNAGWCEAAAAGALAVRLGGANRYGERVEHRPVLGGAGRAPALPDIQRAVRLSRAVTVAATVAAVAFAWRRS